MQGDSSTRGKSSEASFCEKRFLIHPRPLIEETDKVSGGGLNSRHRGRRRIVSSTISLPLSFSSFLSPPLFRESWTNGVERGWVREITEEPSESPFATSVVGFAPLGTFHARRVIQIHGPRAFCPPLKSAFLLAKPPPPTPRLPLYFAKRSRARLLNRNRPRFSRSFLLFEPFSTPIIPFVLAPWGWGAVYSVAEGFSGTAALETDWELFLSLFGHFPGYLYIFYFPNLFTKLIVAPQCRGSTMKIERGDLRVLYYF